MPVRKTLLIGEPVLRETAQEVHAIFDPAVQSVIHDLSDTMRAEELIGMAAPQIGEPLRVFVSELRETKIRKGITDELCVYINPELKDVSHETELDWEGCGSIPDIFGKVERHCEVTVAYTDLNGDRTSKQCSGLLARVVQHEIDHLNGILFTDIADPKTFVSKEYYLEHIRGK